MAKQQAIIDGNTTYAIIAHSGTSDTAETIRLVATAAGALTTDKVGDLTPILSYDNVVTTYPDGTTEVYTYKSGTTAVGTTTAVYLDTTKGSISTVTRT